MGFGIMGAIGFTGTVDGLTGAADIIGTGDSLGEPGCWGFCAAAGADNSFSLKIDFNLAAKLAAPPEIWL